jgi:Radical SAM superfamily
MDYYTWIYIGYFKQMRENLPVKKSILLVNPPLAKPCEAPAGLAKLASTLKANEIKCRIFDASLEGIISLLTQPVNASDTWSRRALNHVQANMEALRSNELYAHPDRYKRAVADINRVLQMAGRDSGVNISLSNYGSPTLSPVRSGDLLQAAEQFEKNPFFPFFQHRFTEYYREQTPDLTGFSLNFMSQALCAFAMVGFIKKRFPQTRIVFGGGLVTSWMNIPGFRNPFEGLVDTLVPGAGENALLSMCGRNSGGASSVTGFDYDQMPLGHYLAAGPILPYATSRGCYWKRCSFCPEKSENSIYQPADVRAAVDDIRHLNAGYKPQLIHFLDNALSPRFLKYLIAHPPGAPWYGFVRITEHLADPGFVWGLKESGCVMLKLGIESGDQAVLNALGKGIDLPTVSRALRALKEASIATYAYLLFGTPAENLDSARKALDFTLSHADAIDFLNLAIFNLPAYSEEARELATADFYQGDLSLYREFTHPKGWSRDKVRRFLAKEFKHPAPIRSILANDPPFFTSNHAPFLIQRG